MTASKTSPTTFKTQVFNHIPPAMIGVVLLFWSFGPTSLLENPWTLPVTSALITATVLLLELVNERHAGWRMNRREFLTDLYYVVLSATVISWTADLFNNDAMTALKVSLGISTEWAMQIPWIAQVILILVTWEFGQYLMHVLMHNWTPAWLMHAPHHHLTQLNAAKGVVGNPFELILVGIGVTALFDVQTTAIFAAVNTMGVISTFAHANVRADPPIWYAFFFTTIRNHSLHHSTDYEATRCNYGNSLILLDRIFGTYRDGEGVLVGQDERKRLSIWEQTLFPFQPVIAKVKASRASKGVDPVDGATA